MKKGSKSGLVKTFGPILGFYTKKTPAFHDYPMEPKITKCGDLLYQLFFFAKANSSGILLLWM
jgi:hypothetical protein